MNNIDKIIEESKLSLNSMDVPIGAIIVKDGVLISSACNTREKESKCIRTCRNKLYFKGSKNFKKLEFKWV